LSVDKLIHSLFSALTLSTADGREPACLPSSVLLPTAVHDRHRCDIFFSGGGSGIVRVLSVGTSVPLPNYQKLQKLFKIWPQVRIFFRTRKRVREGGGGSGIRVPVHLVGTSVPQLSLVCEVSCGFGIVFCPDTAGSGYRISGPGSQTYIFESILKIYWVKTNNFLNIGPNICQNFQCDFFGPRKELGNPGSRTNLFRISDPGVKKAPDPGSGSETLVDCYFYHSGP